VTKSQTQSHLTSDATIDVQEFHFPCLFSCVAWRNVSSKPMWANAEVNACRMRSLVFSDAFIQIMSSMDQRKSSASHTSNRQYNAMHCAVWEQ